MTQPPNTIIITEASFNADNRTPKRFCGFKDDPGLNGALHGSVYSTRTKSLLYTATARSGSAIEIGGHCGVDTLHLADYFHKVHVFEPSSKNLACLKYNIEMNGVGNIETHQEAVSDHEGIASFYLCPDSNSVCHSLTKNLAGNNPSHKTIKVTTLDSAFPSLTDCTFLHIDAEGHDIKVLLGAKQFLKRQGQKPVIIMEFAPNMLKQSDSSVSELVEFLKEFNYCVYTDAGNNLSPISYFCLGELYNLWKDTCCGWLDLILVPIGQNFGIFPGHPKIQ